MVSTSSIFLGQRRGTSSTNTPESTANRAWLTCESVAALLTTSEGSTLSLELVHGHSREGGSSVMLGLVLVDFMDGDGGVNDGWLNSLLLDDRLDVLVDVMVNVLTSNRWCSCAGLLGVTDGAGVLELSLLSRETVLDVRIIAVLDIAVLNTCHLVGVLLREHLSVLDGLNRGVVVVLVNLAVYRGGDIFVSGGCDVFLLNGGVDGLVDSGVMLSVLGEEVANCCLCLFHFD